MIHSNGLVEFGIWNEGILTSDPVVTPQCQMCYQFYDTCDFKISCGNCFNLICCTCYEQHYKKIEKGCIFPKSRVCCPFCRKLSLHLELDDFNDIVMSDSNFSNFGKCKYCLQYEKIEEVCGVSGTADDGNIHQTEFVCKKCVIPEGIKKCPKCSCYIEKNGGCCHMVCEKKIGGCGFEFCWNCFVDWEKKKESRGFHDGKMCLENKA